MSDATHQLRYELRLDAPALVTTLAGDPNTVEGETYVPGSNLLGAFASSWIARHDLGDDAHQNDDFARLFLRGGLSFLNAYLLDDLIGSEQRLLPVPMSFRRSKADQHELFDLTVEEEPDIGSDAKNSRQDATQRLHGYCRIEPGIGSRAKGMVVKRDPKTRLSFHTQRADRLLGRPTDGRGALFAYDALDGGQRFGGVIRGDADDLTRLATGLNWAKNSPLTFSIGRSRSAEYGGQARLKLLDDGPMPWKSEVDTAQQPDGALVLTLTSHLLPFPTGGLDGGLLRFPVHELSVLLRDVGVARGPEQLVTSLRAFTKFVLVGGFSGVWRMPRCQQPAFAAGSVFVVHGVEVDEARRGLIERGALGMRTGEGFGRFVVNWHGDEEAYQLESVATRPPIAQPSEPPPEVFKRVVADVARQWADDRARSRAAALAQQMHHIPTPALLSRMALLLRDLDLDRASAMTRLLDGLRTAAKSQLQACRGPRGSLFDQLRLLCMVDQTAIDDRQAGAIDHELGVSDRPPELLRVTGVSGVDPLVDPAVRGQLANMYVQALLSELRRRKKQEGDRRERGA